jgi:CheY-like chemotaxis protein
MSSRVSRGLQTEISPNRADVAEGPGASCQIARSSIPQDLPQHSAPGDGMAGEERPRLQVLVVEDDALTRELYSCYFDAWNLPVECRLMASALEALADMAHIRPDLLITDLRMAGVDGIEMLKVLKRDRQWADLQVLVVSGMEREAVDDIGGLPEGALFLRKPLSFEWLHGHVTAMLARKARG